MRANTQKRCVSGSGWLPSARPGKPFMVRCLVCSLMACLFGIPIFGRTLSFPVLISATGAPPVKVDCVVNAGPAAPVSALAFSPDGGSLAAGGYEEIAVWDLAAAKLTRRPAGKGCGIVRALTFDRNGGLFAAGGAPGRSGLVALFDPGTGERMAVFDGSRDTVNALALSRDGKLLAAGSADHCVYVWSVADRRLVTTLKEPGDWVLDVTFSPDGKHIAAAGADGVGRLWEVETWKAAARTPESESVRGISFSPDGEMVAIAFAGAAERGVKIFRDNTEQPKTTNAAVKPRRREALALSRAMDSAAGAPLALLWPTQANRIIVPCSDASIRVFTSTGVAVTNLTAHHAPVQAVALSPDEKHLASADADGVVNFWSTADLRLRASLVHLRPRADEWLVLTPGGSFTGLGAPRPSHLAPALENAEVVRAELQATGEKKAAKAGK